MEVFWGEQKRDNLLPEAGVPCASFIRDMGETMLVKQG